MNETRGLWRGKRLNNGERVEGLLTYRSESSARLTDVATDEEFWVDSSTLGECTGLTDKNGKLIFEGDVVKNSYGDQMEVIHDGGDAAFCVSFSTRNYLLSSFKLFELEVIGNIHDNPELIQKGDRI